MRPKRLSLLFIGLLISFQTFASGFIQHLQPAFWWTGFEDKRLQLMVHGEGVGNADVSLNYPGVTLVSTETLENKNYLFLNLELSEEANPGVFDIAFSINGKQVATYAYELKQRRDGSAQRQGFSAKDAIYLITPDRFANGDEGNDEVASLKEGKNRDYKGGRHGGDLKGIIDNLDYISGMGFTQIWLMPVLENDMERYSYHGYSTTDYYTIDPRYGANETYRELSDKGAEKGVGLIMDMILNHIGSEHWWMHDMPSEDWINNKGKFVQTSHRREALHDPHGTKADVDAFNDGWFVPTMPDLNQRNPFLATYLIQNAIWWVEYANLTGIRVDTYSYSNMAFLTEWTRRVMQEYPNLNIVGEEWSVNPAIVAFWQQGTQRHNDYQSYLPSVMDFPLQTKLVSGLKEKENWNSGLRELYEVLASDFLYGDPYNLVIFPDNHDMSRILSQLDDDIDLYKIAMGFFATMRGIPQFFYGTEILMNNPGTDDHGIIRSDFPGGWSGDKVNGFSGEGLSAEQKDAQSFVRKLLNWRKSSDAIGNGKLTHYAPDKGTYVYFRHSDTQTVMVVLNKSDVPVVLDESRFHEMLANKSTATNVINGEAGGIAQTMEIPAKSIRIYEVN